MIEDCALSLLSSDGTRKLGLTGDIAVFNFPKLLPVPDGGAMVVNNKRLLVDNSALISPELTKSLRKMISLFKRRILHGLSWLRCLNVIYAFNNTLGLPSDDSANTWNGRPEMPSSFYYDEKDSFKAISPITRHMLKSFTVPAIIQKRRKNYKLLLQLLNDSEQVSPLYPELKEGVCPLYFPVIAKNRDQLSHRLKKMGILAICFWAGYHRSLPWDDYPDACFLKDNVLILPIHQQLGCDHMEYVAKAIVA